MASRPGEITVLLLRWKEGEAAAFDALLPLVYPHLREVAASYLRRERRPGVMQPTALVHELYLRLVGPSDVPLHDRAHFFTFAAKVMRMILTDQAREQLAQKRGGGAEHVPLSDDLRWVGVGSAELALVSDALRELAEVDPRKVELVELRYFLGCTTAEAAELLGISKATADRDLKLVKSWLYARVHEDANGREA